MSGKTCFDCHKDIAENSKFCSNCGMIQPAEKPVEKPVEKPAEKPVEEKPVEKPVEKPAEETPTPMPVVEIAKTIEEEFDEFLQDLKKKFYISSKFIPYVSFINNCQLVLEKYGMLNLPEKFKQFGPLVIRDRLVDNKIFICRLDDIFPKKYKNIITHNDVINYYKKDSEMIGNFICVSRSLRVIDNKFKFDLGERFIKLINNIVSTCECDEEYILKHLEKIKPNGEKLLD